MRVRAIAIEVDTNNGAEAAEGAKVNGFPLAREDCQLLIEALEDQANDLHMEILSKGGDPEKGVRMRDLAGELRRSVEQTDAAHDAELDRELGKLDADEDDPLASIATALGHAFMAYGMRQRAARQQKPAQSAESAEPAAPEPKDAAAQ